MTLEASKAHWTARDEDRPRIFATSVVFDRVAIATTAALALTSALLLATETDLFVSAPMPAADRALAGKVDSLTRGVRRRPADLPVWDRAFAGDQLYAKDHVFTDQDASAILDLVGGGRLELGENTLVAIDISGPRAVLDVLRGDLRLEAAVPGGEGGKPFEVRVSGKRVALAAKGTLGVRVLGEQKADVMVLDGEGRVGDAVLRAGEGRRLSETTEALLSAPIAMLAPTHGARFYESDVRESGIRFDWQGGDRATLEIAMDSGFSRGLRRVANATPGTVVRDLPPGNYYWRVRDREREDAWNETRRLIIHPTPGIEIAQPTLGEEILRLLPAGAARRASVTFQWRGGGGSGPFRIEVASDAEFAHVVASAETMLTRWASPPLSEGDYHWRVRPKNGKATIGRFRLKALPAPSAPEILAPAAGSSSQVAQPLALTWRAADSAKGYRVEISKDPSFATPLLSRAIDGTSFEWKPEEAGSYHWRVRAIDEAGRLSPVGEMRPLEIQPEAAPVLAPPPLPTRMEILLPWAPKEQKPLWQRILGWLEDEAHAEDRAHGNVRWPPVPGATGYVVEIARDRSFSSPVLKEQVTEPEVGVGAIEPGTYFLRVAAKNEAGVPGPFSPPVELVVQARKEQRSPIAQKSPLPPPKPVAPLDGTVFELKALIPVVSFSWKPVAGATTYELEVRRGDRKGEVVHERYTRGQDAAVELEPGRYVWLIRSLRTRDDESERWSEPQGFEVRHLKQEEVAAEAPPAPPGPEETSQEEPSQATRVRRPNMELFFALAPTFFAYEETGSDPETKIDARLFNTVAAGLSWRWTDWLSVGVSGYRRATVLFRDKEESHPEGQRELLIKPFSLAVTFRGLLHDGTDGSFLEVAIGMVKKSLVTFAREEDQTLAASHLGIQAPLAALRYGMPLRAGFALTVGAEGGFAAMQSTSGVDRGIMASMGAQLLVGPSAAHGIIGYEMAIDRIEMKDGERKIFARAESLLVGTGISF